MPCTTGMCSCSSGEGEVAGGEHTPERRDHRRQTEDGDVLPARVAHDVGSIGTDVGAVEPQLVHHGASATVQPARRHDDGHPASTDRVERAAITFVHGAIAADDGAVEIDGEEAGFDGHKMAPAPSPVAGWSR